VTTVVRVKDAINNMEVIVCRRVMGKCVDCGRKKKIAARGLCDTCYKTPTRHLFPLVMENRREWRDSEMSALLHLKPCLSYSAIARQLDRTKDSVKEAMKRRRRKMALAHSNTTERR
jgi:hypothetical protein